MKSLWILSAAALFTLAAERPARADVMNEPCMFLKAGDACTTTMGQPGTCVQGMLGLVCQANGSSSGSSGTGSSSGSGSGGAGGGGGGSGDKGGCSYRTGADASDAWVGLSLLLAISLLARRRRLTRSCRARLG